MKIFIIILSFIFLFPNEWVKIKAFDTVGWCKKNQIIIKNRNAIVCNTGCVLRKIPNEKEKVFMGLEKGMKILILK